MTDDRPEPRYGQYAPVPLVPAVPPVVDQQPTPATPPTAERQRRTWDVVLTTALLLIGVYDVASSSSVFANLGPELDTLYQQQGFGHFTSLALASQFGIGLTVARVVLLVAAIVWSLALLRARRLAFWVPLGAGVIAFLAVVACVLVLVVSDPALAQYVASHPSAG
jgi:uncharacterized membrane protein YqgA involved in biofilm formation